MVHKAITRKQINSIMLLLRQLMEAQSWSSFLKRQFPIAIEFTKQKNASHQFRPAALVIQKHATL
jgi:hypothetical protein